MGGNAFGWAYCGQYYAGTTAAAAVAYIKNKIIVSREAQRRASSW